MTKSAANQTLTASTYTLRASVVAALIASLLPLGQAEAQITHRVIAKSGDAAPSGGNYLHLNTISSNAQGKVAFDAGLNETGGAGIFAFDGATVTVVALGDLSGDPGTLGFLSSPFVDERGGIFFSGDNAGILRSDRKQIVPVVRNGDPAPAGGSLIPQTYLADASGAIAYLALVTGDANTTGIFRGHGAGTSAVARLDQLPATGGTFQSFGGFAVNRFHQVAYYSVMTGGSANFAIFRKDGDATKTIFAMNEKAPGGGLFGDFSDPVMNEFGQVLTEGFALQNTSSDFGLFVSDGETVKVIALSGHPAPKGGNYFRDTFAPSVLNNRGEVAFNIGLNGGSSTSGIFRGDGIRTTPIALQGTPAPGTTGTFELFNGIRMDNTGMVVFSGTLTLGVGGVDATNNAGIWVGTSEKDLQLVVRSGDVIDGNVVKCIPTTANRFSLNGRGIVWISGCGGRPNDLAVFSILPREHGEHYEY